MSVFSFETENRRVKKKIAEMREVKNGVKDDWGVWSVYSGTKEEESEHLQAVEENDDERAFSSDNVHVEEMSWQPTLVPMPSN